MIGVMNKLNVMSRLRLPQLPFRAGVVYGPIQSRRIGWSLGINLCPAAFKVCSFDCVYCQFPEHASDWRGDADRLLRGPELLRQIELGIRERIERGIHFDSITLAGNGDPSVHPELLTVVRHIRNIIESLDFDTALSIFTNAVPYEDENFIESLRLCDRRLIKLDGADEEMLRRIDRPRARVDLERRADALAILDGVIVQTMVVRGLVDNRASIRSPEFSRLARRMGATEIQLYTIDKRPARSGVQAVSEQELEALAEEMRRGSSGLPVKVYFQDCPSGFPNVVPPVRGGHSA